MVDSNYLNCFHYATGGKLSLTNLEKGIAAKYEAMQNKKGDQKKFAGVVMTVISELCANTAGIDYQDCNQDAGAGNVILCLGGKDGSISNFDAYGLHFAKKIDNDWVEVPSAKYTSPQNTQKKPVIKGSWKVKTGETETSYTVKGFFNLTIA